MKFVFHGKISANESAEDEKKYFYRGGATKNGNPYGRINLSVIQSKNNRAFMEMFGMEQDPIKTMNTENKGIEIAWDDRNDKDVIKEVANYRKNIIDMGNGDRHEFISTKDAVDFIKNNINEINGKNFVVTGSMDKNEYNGKISDRFNIQNMYLQEEDDEASLKVNGEFFFTKDSIDAADFKDEKKLYLNGWVSQYINKTEGSKYFPQQLVFDLSKVDFDNEKHMKLVNYRLKQIGCSLEDGKVKVNLKAKGVYKVFVVCKYVNGAEEIPFSKDELTANQKEALEIGLKTLDDFRPKGSIYGNRITVLNLVDFDLRDDYADGYVTTEMTNAEFEDQIYVVAKSDDNFDGAMNPPKNDKAKGGSEDEDMMDLFG